MPIATYRLVTRVVAKGIVEILEIVDVDHQQAERMTKPLHTTHLSLQLSFKSTAIGETSQVVRKRRLFANVQISFELKQRSGPGQQEIEIGRVSDVSQRTDLGRSAQIFDLRARGSLHDYRNKLRDRIGPDSLGQLVAIHPRHHDVGYHQVRLVRFDGRECLITVRGRGYVITGQAQCSLDQSSICRGYRRRRECWILTP